MPLSTITFRDHFASLFQSTVTEVGHRMAADPLAPRTRSGQALTEEIYAAAATDLMQRRLGGNAYVASSMDAARTRALGIGKVRECASLALRSIEAHLSGDPTRIAQVNGEFKTSACDPAWATTVMEYLQFFGPGGRRREIPYIDPASAGERVIRIKDGARVALIADWGTGSEPAREVLTRIGELKPDVLIHLGDVYYSGTPREYERGFRDLINEVLGTDRSAIPIFALSGNHDMYCGGSGFYGLIDTINKGNFRQVSSYFCLRSEDNAWQFLAMDTGLNDYNPIDVRSRLTFLRNDEAEWLMRRVSGFPGRTLLLSHHQMFSAFSQIEPASSGSPCNPHLLQFFASLSQIGKICAWFWGHEHTLAIYEPFAGLERGRCIGCGAVPVASTERLYSPLEGLKNAPRIFANTQLGLDGNVFAHGFAMIELGKGGAPAQAKYYQCRNRRSELLFSEVFD